MFNGFVWTQCQLHLRAFVRTIIFFSQVKDARMLNFTDFNGKDMALPLPSFEGATMDAL